MAEVKRRIRYLFYILTQQDHYVRACDLAAKAGVSERTIKSDISELSEYAHANGAEIVSKKGAGYRLVAKDVEKANALKSQLEMHFQAVGSTQNPVKTRINEILRRIVVEEKWMSIEDVAEELFLTKSSIREEMKQVNMYLDKFNLRWKKKQEDGPLLLGNELDRRLLMLCVFENHYHEAVNVWKDDDFLYWFDCEQEIRYDIRHIFLRNLRESECHVRDDHTQRLSRYLCLMINRVKAGHTICFDDAQRRYIRKLRQSLVSRRIMYDLSKYPEFAELPEDETLAFGLLLAQWADISRSCDLKRNYPDQLKEAEAFLEKYEQRIQKDYGIVLNHFKNYRRILTAGLIPLLIQKDFRTCNQPIRIVFIQDSRIKDCPLAAQIACDASLLFEMEYGIPLSLYNVLTLSSQFHSLFLSISYDFKPVRSLICTGNGLHASYALSKLIEARYGDYFEKFDTYELYEMRGLKTEDYDCAIVDLPYFTYKYEWPCLIVDPVPTQKQMNEIYNQFVLNNVQLEEVFEHLSLERINVYRDFVMESEDTFLKLLSYKMGKDAASVKNIEKSLRYRTPVCVYNKVCVLFVKRTLTSANSFDIYQLKSESVFNDEPVKLFVVMSFDFDKSLQAARFINDATYMFFSDASALDKIVETASKKELIHAVRESLKTLPIALV